MRPAGHERAVRPFRYCLDPVCLVSAVIYACNRWLIKPSPLGRLAFVHDQLNDVLCIPIFLPCALLVHHLLHLRMRGAKPTAAELLIHLMIWSVCFEVVAPSLPGIYRTTADWRDVAAYALGAALAGLVWKSWRLPRSLQSPGAAGSLSAAAGRAARTS